MTTPLDPIRVIDGIARNFTTLFSSLRASVVQQLYAIWYGLDSYRDGSIPAWLDMSLPLVKASQETSAVATTSYIKLQLEVMGIDDSKVEIPPLTDVTGAVLRKGVPPEEVYSRPFKDVWGAISKGKDVAEAIKDGADRIRQLVETDIQLAHTHTSRHIFSSNKDVVGFRRVPQGTFTCALCLLASTQRYNKLDLMPIHPGCDCRVAPIVAGEKSGRLLDPELLERIHEAVEERYPGYSDRSARAIDYRKILLGEEEHGEYGPTLVAKGHLFTSKDDLKKYLPE